MADLHTGNTFADINIMLDGKYFAHRSWLHVPRVGDEIMLGKPKKAYVVKRVVWGVEGDGPEWTWRQAVNIEIEPTP